MTKVKVYLPPFFKQNKLPENGYLELPENTTLLDLFRLLELPLPPVSIKLCRVNYEKVNLKTRLNDGDIVSFFSFLSGG